MAPTTYTLIALKDNVSDADFVSTLQELADSHRPLFVGKCQHWIHPPHISSSSLLGTASKGIKGWDYLLVNELDTLPDPIKTLAKDTWSLTYTPDESISHILLSTPAARQSAPNPTLPPGWSPEDHSGLDASIPPPDLEASLALSSYPLGSDVQAQKCEKAEKVVLKDLVRDFGTKHDGRIWMFNLLSYMPGQRNRYLEYRAAFMQNVGIKYGGMPVFASDGVVTWSSKEAEKGQEGEWEDTALVQYPSIWHFGKMLDDPGYAEADRKFKVGAVRDNAILCVVEVEN